MRSPDRAGHGTAACHHGELIQGVFLDGDVQQVTGVVTVPCPLFGSRASFVPRPDGPLTVSPPDRVKARRAVELLLEGIAYRGGGQLTIDSNVPVGWGMGSSTSDVVASIRAAARAFDICPSPEAIARIAVPAEHASDPIMFDEVVLFASRRGEVLERLGEHLPAMNVLGFSTCPATPAVETVAMPTPEYTAAELSLFAELRGGLQHAIARQAAAVIGEIATESARVGQRYRAKPHFDELLSAIPRTGAIGLQVAHTGSVAGFLFDEATAPRGIDRARPLVESLGLGPTWTFRIESPRPQRSA